MLSYKLIINKLLKKGITLSVAESFTGGLLSSIFIKTPGISKIFNMGLITYSNDSKKKILRISTKNIKKYGAVSNVVAKEMLINLHKISKSKLCISTTGIAGPSGGTNNKPVGLVYIGIKFNKKIIILEKKIKGTRNQIKQQSIKYIFNYLDKLL